MKGFYLKADEIKTFPTSGPAWDVVKKAADAANGDASLIDQNSNLNVNCMGGGACVCRNG